MATSYQLDTAPDELPIPWKIVSLFVGVFVLYQVSFYTLLNNKAIDLATSNSFLTTMLLWTLNRIPVLCLSIWLVLRHLPSQNYWRRAILYSTLYVTMCQWPTFWCTVTQKSLVGSPFSFAFARNVIIADLLDLMIRLMSLTIANRFARIALVRGSQPAPKPKPMSINVLLIATTTIAIDLVGRRWLEANQVGFPSYLFSTDTPFFWAIHGTGALLTTTAIFFVFFPAKHRVVFFALSFICLLVEVGLVELIAEFGTRFGMLRKNVVSAPWPLTESLLFAALKWAWILYGRLFFALAGLRVTICK